MAKKRKKGSWLPWVLIVGVAGSAGYLFWQKMDRAKTVAANGVIERCYELRAGETIKYSFKGEDLVAFDIRRGGDGMFSPQVVPFDQGDFTADSSGEYCLRFVNALPRPQKISYSVQRQAGK
ncbi:hypothetical protein HPT27_04345 [Permianibacter sp. IMCC34836]|uniref:hypothetical protein n=1 Tax=Permianibacter fluminis TaxID=2738515 RepID=UPI0015582B4F|nr:hypothetical protein [Permianibacter fluminis]NQD36244.1 hypothetical protein [Permianibacter fluminis]